jgi:hypothetical protein
MPTRIMFLCLLTAAAGCASSGAAPASAGPAAPAAATARRDPDVITREELAADRTLISLNAYDAIRTLRPRFLRTRGAQNFGSGSPTDDQESGQPHASIDGAGVVPLDDLKNVEVRNVIEIRYLDAAAAMQRFGSSAHAGPVIVVRTM